MDMPDLYYWVATVFTLGQMLKALFQQLKRLKRKKPKPKRKRRKRKRRK